MRLLHSNSEHTDCCLQVGCQNCPKLRRKGMLARLSRSCSSAYTQQRLAFSSTAAVRGLEDFFEAPLKEGEQRTSGKEWKAVDLRKKSWEDLHQLWYVLLKEKNLLESEKARLKAELKKLPNPERKLKVRKSMARIKQVMSERAYANESPHVKGELMRYINAL